MISCVGFDFNFSVGLIRPKDRTLSVGDSDVKASARGQVQCGIVHTHPTFFVRCAQKNRDLSIIRESGQIVSMMGLRIDGLFLYRDVITRIRFIVQFSQRAF
jgi:hypothetical protein